MRVNLLRLFFFLLTGGIPLLSEAQDFAGYNWYFSSGNRGIRFSRSDNSATLTSQTPLSTGGSAVVSDPTNGNLLFYTNGITVYDASHGMMANGGGLSGDGAGNQGVVVAKVPGETSKYYIITRDAAGTITYSTVNMALTGTAVFPAPARGAVETKNVAAGLTGRSEAMLTVQSDGADFWLITHQTGTATYSVTRFTSTGPTTTQNFTLGVIDAAANFAYHPATGQIAVSPNTASRNVEILDFAQDSGVLTFVRNVPNSFVTAVSGGEAIYDTEWSPSGDFLYISRHGGAGVQADVLQFNVADTSTPAPVLQSVLPQPNTVTESYGIQMGPDSAIYHLYLKGGQMLLGKITNTDTVAAETDYTERAFGGTFTGEQFPSFAPPSDLTINVAFTYKGTCANAPTAFFPTVTPHADSLVWDFGDGNTSREWSPVHTYEAAGNVTVGVTAYLNGQSATATQILSIQEFDTQITLVQDTTACSCELPFPKAANPPPPCPQRFSVTAQVSGSGAGNLQWFGPGGRITGATSATLQPDSAGYYYLVAEANGCQAYAGVNIKEYGVEDQRANIWYFGNNAGLDFNPMFDDPPSAGPVPISNPVMQAPEGTATISDRNGQVIFFTDGNRVWDRDFTEIASGIGGDLASTQSALIMPVPGDETLFYIFTTQQIYPDDPNAPNIYELRYTLFDLKLNGGSGGIVDPDGNPATPDVSTVLFTKSTERITGNANWLIAHEYGNNSFRAYRITAQGISNPVISAIGSDHSYSSDAQGEGYMKLSSQGTLAVALSTPNASNAIEIFNFADSSGTVSNFRRIDLPSSGQLYGMEFSPSGRKLYASTIGSSTLYELAYDSATRTYTQRPELPPVTPPGEIGAIQIGPGGTTIYVANQDGGNLGTIQVADDDETPSTYDPQGQPLEGGTSSKLGLPNFIQIIADPLQGPGLSVTGLCFGDSTSFTGSGTDVIDTLTWFFGDGTAQSGVNLTQVSHVYARPGDYTVILRISNRCVGLVDEIRRNITIHGLPPEPPMLLPGEQPVICNDQPKTLVGAQPVDPTFSFVWSTGDTTATITVTQPNRYSVTVTNAFGCVSADTIDIYPYFNNFDLGPDQTICQNATATIDADVRGGGITYTWFVNEVNNGNTARTQPVATATPGGPTEYKVRVQDQFCFATDSVNYTIMATPDFTAQGIPTTSCSADDGSISINFISPVGSPLSYSIQGPSPASGTNVIPAAVIDVLNRAPGVYRVTVTDQLTGCALEQDATISDPTFTVTAAPQGTCDPDITLLVQTSVAVGPLTYNVVNATTNQTVISGITQPSSNFPTGFSTPTPGPIRSGNSYIVQITENTALGCQAFSPAVAVTQGPAYTVTFDEGNLCANGQITAAAAGATVFDWTASEAGSIASTTGTNGETAVLNSPGTWDLQVIASNPAGAICPGTGTVTVTVADPLDAQFTNTTACADDVTLTATPTASNFLYRWIRSDQATPIPGGPTYTVSDDGITFAVQIVNTQNGCTDDSPSRVIPVNGLLEVMLTNTFPCENAPFTLTATPSRAATSFAWTYNGAAIPNETEATLDDTRAGTYTVVVTAPTNCQASAQASIILAPSTPGSLPSVYRICPEPEAPADIRVAELDPGAGFQTYEWFEVNGSSTSPLGVATQTYTTDVAGEYLVKLLNDFGCITEDKTEVIVNCDPIITGPNAFRPGSSLTTNQVFKLFTIFIDEENFEIFIFNRWGEMVFQSDQRDFAWNGGYNNKAGELLPAGTYTYVVRYQSAYQPEMGIREKRGGVVLMR